MNKLENLINGAKLTIVLCCFLLGSVTEVYIPVVATLVTVLIAAVAALVFFLAAKKRYEKLSVSFAKMDKAAKDVIKKEVA